mgnify:FL=1
MDGEAPSGGAWPFGDVGPEELLAMAEAAAWRAYVPYSRFRVGSALLLEDGAVVTAANVENASYGLTLCAERCAVAVMVAQGRRSPVAMAVVGFGADERDRCGVVPCPPCGACRQTLMEFNPKLRVVLASEEGPQVFMLSELLPYAFTLGEEGRR